MYEIKEISPEEATEIIENREDEKNYGLFILVELDGFTGIDNSDGNAWTEDFGTRYICEAWLKGEFEISDLENESASFEIKLSEIENQKATVEQEQPLSEKIKFEIINKDGSSHGYDISRDQLIRIVEEHSLEKVIFISKY